MSERKLDDYVEVAERIGHFRDAYPAGSLRGDFRMIQVSGQDMIAYRAEAYRDATDQAPGVGCAWELVPGRTNFTRGSELQNAETSAWGRAIIAVGASDSKRGIASREEVRNQRDATRLVDEAREMRRKPPEVDEHGAATVAEQTRMMTGPEPGTTRTKADEGNDPWYDNPKPLADLPNPEDAHGTATADQIRTLQAKFAANGIGIKGSEMTRRNEKIAWLVDKFGPDIHSSKDLSYSQAARALQELR